MPDSSQQLLALAGTIRKFRRDRELSQEALAAVAGINPKHLSEIERANKDPRASTVLRLAEALGLTPTEFFNGYELRLRSSGPARAIGPVASGGPRSRT